MFHFFSCQEESQSIVRNWPGLASHCRRASLSLIFKRKWDMGWNWFPVQEVKNLVEVSGVLWSEFQLWSAAGMVWKFALLNVWKAREELNTHARQDPRTSCNCHNWYKTKPKKQYWTINNPIFKWLPWLKLENCFYYKRGFLIECCLQSLTGSCW